MFRGIRKKKALHVILHSEEDKIPAPTMWPVGKMNLQDAGPQAGSIPAVIVRGGSHLFGKARRLTLGGYHIGCIDQVTINFRSHALTGFPVFFGTDSRGTSLPERCDLG